MLKKTSILIFISIIIMGCCPEQDFTTVNVELTDIDFRNFSIEDFEYRSAEATINYQDYVMAFNTTANGPADTSPPEVKGGIFRSPNCDAPDPEFFINDPFVDFSIKPTSDYSSTYPSGTEMNGAFGTKWIRVNPLAEPSVRLESLSLDYSLINDQIVNFHSTRDYFEQEPIFIIGLSPNAIPDTDQPISFDVVATLKNGSTLSVTTPLVQLVAN